MSSTNDNFLGILIFLRLLILISIIYSVFKWKFSSVENGYCDNNSSTNSIINEKIIEIENFNNVITNDNDNNDVDFKPFWSSLPQPLTCTPCPQFASCINGRIISCDEEFILMDPLLKSIPIVKSFVNALDGFPFIGPVAIPPKCEPDSEKRALVAEIGVHLLQSLEIKKGQVICNSSRKIKDESQLGIAQNEIYETINSLKDKSIPQLEFNDIWELAIKDLESNNEIKVVVNNDNDNATLISTNAFIPLKCKLKLTVYSFLFKWKLELFATLTIMASYMVAKNKVRQARNERKEISDLVKLTLKTVQKRSSDHSNDPIKTPTAYIIPSQLRDLALEQIHSPIERQKLWNKVKVIIESNSNIQLKQIEIEGEITDVIEWKNNL